MNFSEHYKSYLSSSLKMKDFCERVGIPFNAFRGYVVAQKRKENSKKPGLIPVKVRPGVESEEALPASISQVERDLCQLSCRNGFVLSFREFPNPEWLHKVLQGG